MKEQNYQTNQTTQEEQDINESVYQPKKKKRWLKITIWIVAIIIIITILLFSFPYILNIIYGKDAPSPDDSDLVLSAANIPKNDNSYFDLIKLSSILDGQTKKAQIKIDIPSGINDLKFLESNNWDINLIEELLNKNEKALQIFSEAANKTQFQFDITGNPENIQPNMPVVALNSWRQIARINAIKAIYLMRQGEEESAFNEVIKIIKIGHDIEKSKNIHLLGYFVGIAIEQEGLKTMQTLISNTSLPSEILSFYQEQIQKYRPTNNSDQLRVEYLSFKNAINYVQNSGLDKDMQNLSKNNFYFKPNQTLEFVIKHYRQMIDRFEKPCYDASNITGNLPEVLPWKIYFTENAVGKMLASLTMVALDGVRDKKCNIDTLIDSADILFAIKKYRLEKKSYPQSLQSLSPNYIIKLPDDPFSGQPFIVNIKDSTIHSVGANQNDDNGQSDDILSSYNFAVVKAKTIDITKKTQPNANLDSDKDGLTDEDEIIYGTDPNNSDTDGDGYSDGQEISHGYDPLH
ncbi:MAG: hypothetical protein U9O55_03320 [Patescibacteria group bacterium]|nr:hypothetical protein [Patescibacteria group bacterium]